MPLMLRKLTESECLSAEKQGEFRPELLASSSHVAIVLTQGWCPQWAWMRSYLDEIASLPDVDIYWVEYDREPFYQSFMNFKETVLGNNQIPYVRYYRDGALTTQSNFLDRRGFRRLLGI